MRQVIVCDHPLIQHKLTMIRDKRTGKKAFRELVDEVAMLMAYESTRDLALTSIEVETPVDTCTAHQLAGKKLGLVPILRAGLGMVEGVLKLIPSAKVGHLGMYRNEETLDTVEYYAKLPEDIQSREMIVLDPMLATGGSAISALNYLKQKGATRLKLMCLIAAPEGISKLHQAHPDVPLYVASIDQQLNEKGYIMPGLGDAGDRLFGTK
jgi:uracil phosphoribosyltransferase